jgi:hypothetical protein
LELHIPTEAELLFFVTNEWTDNRALGLTNKIKLMFALRGLMVRISIEAAPYT